jgi:HEAT repeat protein
MTPLRPTTLLLVVALGASLVAQSPAPTAAELAAAIDALGSLDAYEVRMEASRTVRRASVELAVPALTRAAKEHPDEYVRYRALVLLSGFSQSSTQGVMRELLGDRNDRIRTVAAAWFEHHPDPQVLSRLVEALSGETSEFVRPALSRAVAAQGDDPAARDVLVPLVSRGEDYFRGAVIEALGDYRGAYALPAIVSVARLDGPLQDDAITAIGRIGEASELALLVELQRSAPEHLQPTISAAICLLGLNCEAHEKFVVEALAFAAQADDRQALLRGAVHAAEMLARSGHDQALAALLAAGVEAGSSAQAPIALGVGLVALRDPAVVLRVLARSPVRDGAILLLRDAFDMLNEDFEEERFFVEVRKAYWAAGEGSAERQVAESLIRVLEF